MNNETREVIQNLIDAGLLDLDDVLDGVKTTQVETVDYRPYDGDEQGRRIVIVKAAKHGIVSYTWESQLGYNECDPAEYDSLSECEDDEDWSDDEQGEWTLSLEAAKEAAVAEYASC